MQLSTMISPGTQPGMNSERGGRIVLDSLPEIVRTLMLYGENNPVDGAVLRVILRKAEKIRKELGVAVPLPSRQQQTG